MNKSIEGITTFKCQDHPDTEASSKMVWDDSTQPHRIVLVKQKASSLGGYEYVTYQENLILLGDGTFKHRDFYWGHYFGENRTKAVEDFQKRSKDL